MNPAALQFLKQKTSEIRESGIISGTAESKNAKLDREMQEHYKHRWPAAGDTAMRGVENATFPSPSFVM